MLIFLGLLYFKKLGFNGLNLIHVCNYFFIFSELPYPPSNVLATLNDDAPRAVHVEWEPGFDGGSDIRYYILQYRMISGGVNSLRLHTVVIKTLCIDT